MATETELGSDRVERMGRKTSGRASARRWVAAGLALIALVGGWLRYSRGASRSSSSTHPAALPEVVVSKPLVQDLDAQLGFLGQFSAVSQVELRAQVGGTLTGIFFKDGDIVRKGDLLFTIDPRPYEITLAEATAQLNVASAHLELADRQLDRAKDLDRATLGAWKTWTSAHPISGPRALQPKTRRPGSGMRSSTLTTAGLRRRSLGAWASISFPWAI